MGDARSGERVEVAVPRHDESAYLEAFLDARGWAMSQEEGHRDLSRVRAQRSFVESGNLALTAPLQWTMYGDSFTIVAPQSQRCP